MSAITSNRASAWAFNSRGPLATSHANFICGRPEILERPLIVNVREGVFAAKLRGLFSGQREIEEHFVGDHGDLALRANLVQSRRPRAPNRNGPWDCSGGPQSRRECAA